MNDTFADTPGHKSGDVVSVSPLPTADLDFHALAAVLTAQVPMGSLLETLAEVLSDMLNCRSCGLAMRTTDDEVVTLRMSRCEPNGQRAAWRQVTLPVDNGGPVTRHVRSRGATLVVEDFRNLPHDLYDPDLAKEGVASALVVPLKRSSIDYGTLGIYNDSPRKFPAEEIHFMETARNLLMLAVERSRLEHNLRIADRLRESMLQSMQTFYVLMRADGQIVDMNRAMQDVCGFRLDEIQGRSFVGLFALDREAESIAAVLKTIAADPVHLICRMPTKHGEVRRVAWMFAMANAPEKHRQYIATGTDITEQAVALERAEHAQCEVQKLRESLMVLRSAIDAGDIVQVRRVVVDMEERSKDDLGAVSWSRGCSQPVRRRRERAETGWTKRWTRRLCPGGLKSTLRNQAD